MIDLPRYDDILSFLENAERLAGVLEVYRHLVGPLPDGGLSEGVVRGMNVQLVEAMEKRFAIHEDDVLSLDGEVLTVQPLWGLVHYTGFDYEYGDFVAYADPLKLMVCLAPLFNSDQYEYWEEQSDVAEWWHDRSGEYDLPPLSQLDLGDETLIVRINTLARASQPWNGLHAIARWIIGEEGCPFVDWSCDAVYAGGAAWDGDIEWSVDQIDEIAELYAWADAEIFQHIRRLDNHCAAHPEALRTCFGLLLGRVSLETVGIAADGVGDEPKPLAEVLTEACCA